jgi:hypothetical protein
MGIDCRYHNFTLPSFYSSVPPIAMAVIVIPLVILHTFLSTEQFHCNSNVDPLILDPLSINMRAENPLT